MRQIQFTCTMYEPILEEGDDENVVIEEMIERDLPPGATLVDWHFV